MGPPGRTRLRPAYRRKYALYLFGIPSDPARAEAITAKQRALADALPASGRKPFTFPNPDETVTDAFTPDVLARLRDIKRCHDPRNVFRANFPMVSLGTA